MGLYKEQKNTSSKLNTSNVLYVCIHEIYYHCSFDDSCAWRITIIILRSLTPSRNPGENTVADDVRMCNQITEDGGICVVHGEDVCVFCCVSF